MYNIFNMYKMCNICFIYHMYYICNTYYKYYMYIPGAPAVLLTSFGTRFVLLKKNGHIHHVTFSSEIQNPLSNAQCKIV